jgi:hypothetical protein
VTSPFTPLVSAEELGTYLNDSSIDPDRAAMLIEDAQLLCQSVVSPLPEGANIVIRRVAARAYVTITSARSQQLAAANAPFGVAQTGTGGLWLSRADEADLRRLAGGGGAFSIDLLPVGYTLPAPSIGTFGFDVPA